MNGVKDLNRISVKQTAKGVWYCDEAMIYFTNIPNAADDLDTCMSMIEGVLNRHNYGPTGQGEPHEEPTSL